MSLSRAQNILMPANINCIVILYCSFFISYFYTFVEDFEACAQALHRLGYSCPRLTAATGTSAGGLIVGAVCNRSPELMKAVILKVSCSFVCFFCGYRALWIIGRCGVFE